MKVAKGKIIGLSRQRKSDGGLIYLIIGEAFKEGLIELTNIQAERLAKRLLKLAKT